MTAAELTAKVRHRLYPVVLPLLEHHAARLVRSRRLVVVAVTGSVAKTSTVKAIAEVLAARYRVLSTGPDNRNSHLNVPLVIFGLTKPRNAANPLAWLRILWRMSRRVRQDYPYDALVLELGTLRPGQIARFMRYLDPEIGVITGIKSVHLPEFGTLEAILEEKFQLALGSRRVLLNADDDRLMDRRSALAPETVMTYGLGKSDFWFELEEAPDGAGFRGKLHLGEAEVGVSLHVLGRHSLYPLIAAGAVGKLLGIGAGDIKSCLESFRPVPGRMNLLEGKNQSRIIDDTYNANSAATIAALEALYALPGRRIAVLGIAGLGEYAEEKLADVGRQCGRLDWLVTVGDECNRYLALAAIDAGLTGERVRSFAGAEPAGTFVSGLLRSGDTALVKGSASMRLEEAVKCLLANPADVESLVRRSPERRPTTVRADASSGSPVRATE